MKKTTRFTEVCELLRQWRSTPFKIVLGFCILFMSMGPLSAGNKKKQKRTQNPFWSTVLPETPETHAIAKLLKVYRVYDSQGPIYLRRIGRTHDGGYVVPVPALLRTDVVMGYGISDDISFEDTVTRFYGKPSFGFDCTCPLIQPTQAECYFIPSCIVGEGEMTHFQNAGTFEQHMNAIGALDKKIFVKMDIEGSEYSTLPDILKNAQNITGIVLEIHFLEAAQIAQALDLLQRLDQDFYLIHVHGNNYCRDGFVTANAKGKISRVLELSYINRNLAHHAELAPDQRHPTPLDMPNTSYFPDIAFTILD